MNAKAKKESPQKEEVPQGAALEAGASEAANTSDSKEVKQLKEQLEQAEAERAAHWDQLVRQQAENQNMARRHKSELSDAHKHGIKHFARDLLPVLDGLESGLKHAAGHDESDPVYQGLQLTHTLLLDALSKHGVVQVPSLGLPFDAKVHEALAMAPHDEIPAQHVSQVVQEGYMLHDRVLRPARVIVSKGLEEQTEKQASDADGAAES